MDAFYWAKRKAWLEWERKHTLPGGTRLVEDPSVPEGVILTRTFLKLAPYPSRLS
jgi:hypothetical protein